MSAWTDQATEWTGRRRDSGTGVNEHPRAGGRELAEVTHYFRVNGMRVRRVSPSYQWVGICIGFVGIRTVADGVEAGRSRRVQSVGIECVKLHRVPIQGSGN
jgi:hypothetical protein